MIKLSEIAITQLITTIKDPVRNDEIESIEKKSLSKKFKPSQKGAIMYLEVWIDRLKKNEVLEKLKDLCDEVHEVFYDYDLIVRVSELKEDLLKVDGVKSVRRHYNC